MLECIRRDAAINAVKSLESSIPAKDNYAKGYDAAIGRALIAVRAVPSALDAQPARFARWIDLGNRILCSGCSAGYDDSDEVKRNTYIFCPNCGARMEGDSLEK